jgi:actin-like ATPase involved in cell morphogenesis
MSTSLSGSLTVRLGAPAMRTIRARARALGITPSRLVRDVIERAVGATGGEASLYELTGKWVGSVNSPTAPAGRDAREVLRDWQPDRRG